MTTIKEITRCRSRAERIDLCIKYLLRTRSRYLTLHCNDDDVWYVGHDCRETLTGPNLDALLLDACRRVETQTKVTK